MVKMTFTLDDATVAHLRRTAERQRKPQSWIVREAVAEYAQRADRLSATEKRHLLEVVDRVRRAATQKSAAAVDRELADLRAARRGGGRRHPQP